jgi:hypothetical protein
LAVSAYFLWARAARQVKCADFSKHLDSQFATGSFRSLRTLWQDWSLCQDGNFISLMNPRPAVRMITAMLDAGIAKKQMLILSTPEGSPLSSQIKGMNIPSRPCEPRKLRKAHRLFFVPHGVEAKTANAATLSVVGLHWWVLLLGSSLISKGEI